jgi:hypothetical protein
LFPSTEGSQQVAEAQKAAVRHIIQKRRTNGTGHHGAAGHVVPAAVAYGPQRKGMASEGDELAQAVATYATRWVRK